jgi:hypothetical protein
MTFYLWRGHKGAGVTASLLTLGLAAGAVAQAPTPVLLSDGSYTVNADVDTYFVDFGGDHLGGEVEPGVAASGVAANSINDETYATFLLPNLNGGTFSSADFNVYLDNSENGLFAQPDFNANLLTAPGAVVDLGETDDNMSYSVGSPTTTNNYTNSVENLTYTEVAPNFLLPTGNGSNHYGNNGYITISSSSAGTDGESLLTTQLNLAEAAYTTSPDTPVYFTFTLDSDEAVDSSNPDGKLSAYTLNGLSGSAAGAATPEFLSYTVTPVAAPEPGAWVTIPIGIGGILCQFLARRRGAHPNKRS